jgi:hypothetical protein
MKTLNEYLTESVRQYVYRVKIAGELDTSVYDKIKAALDKFDVADCSKPTKTPIQSDPYGFPGLHNAEINIFDVTLNYPANSQQIVELAKQSGVDPSKIVVVSKEFNDGMNQEAEGLEDGTRLDTPLYPEPTKEQKAASDAYADSYKKAASEFASAGNTEFEIAGGKPKPVNYNTDTADGSKSPLTTVKRKSIGDLYK